MDNLLMAGPEPAKEKKKNVKRKRSVKTPKHSGVNVRVNVVNHAPGSSKKNQADDALYQMRGF